MTLAVSPKLYTGFREVDDKKTAAGRRKAPQGSLNSRERKANIKNPWIKEKEGKESKPFGMLI